MISFDILCHNGDLMSSLDIIHGSLKINRFLFLSASPSSRSDSNRSEEG